MSSAKLLALRPLDSLIPHLRAKTGQLRGAARALGARAWSRVRMLRREHFLWAALIVVFLVYVLVLLLEPTSAGRGGR